MGEFELYFNLGLQHIADLKAYDHILFLVALCAMYQLKDWKNVLILVTAFTIGHSITLALSVLEVISFPEDVIEILIPITIMLTALFNLWSTRREVALSKSQQRTKYGIALFFGFIHGIGFSNYLKFIIETSESNIVSSWIAFNIGVEAGQIGIILVILAISFVFMNVFKVPQRYWNWIVSTLAFIIAGNLLIGLL